MVLGQEQDEFGGGFSIDQSLNLEISDLNAWGKSLSTGEIQNSLTCKIIQDGDLIEWDMANWSMKEGEVIFTEKAF